MADARVTLNPQMAKACSIIRWRLSRNDSRESCDEMSIGACAIKGDGGKDAASKGAGKPDSPKDDPKDGPKDVIPPKDRIDVVI